MPILIINTPEEARTFAERLEAESERVKVETGKGPGAIRLGLGGIERAIYMGDVLAIATDGAEHERVAIWLHREPGQGVYITHLWGPSARHPGLTRWVAQKMVDRGDVSAHFSRIDMPLINAMAAIVLPATGNYNASNVWTPSPTGRLYRVRFDAGLARLVAAGAPVEA